MTCASVRWHKNTIWCRYGTSRSYEVHLWGKTIDCKYNPIYCSHIKCWVARKCDESAHFRYDTIDCHDDASRHPDCVTAIILFLTSSNEAPIGVIWFRPEPYRLATVLEKCHFYVESYQSSPLLAKRRVIELRILLLLGASWVMARHKRRTFINQLLCPYRPRISYEKAQYWVVEVCKRNCHLYPP